MSFAMNLYLPIAGNSVNCVAILGLGGVVGLLSGIFGVGGGLFDDPLADHDGYPANGGRGIGFQPDRRCFNSWVPVTMASL